MNKGGGGKDLKMLADLGDELSLNYLIVVFKCNTQINIFKSNHYINHAVLMHFVQKKCPKI